MSVEGGKLLGAFWVCSSSSSPPPLLLARVVELLVTVSLTPSYDLISPAFVVKKTQLPGPLLCPFHARKKEKGREERGGKSLYLFRFPFSLSLKKEKDKGCGEGRKREGKPSVWRLVAPGKARMV